jgi:hypothetical protein
LSGLSQRYYLTPNKKERKGKKKRKEKKKGGIE